jgi:AcrR family transcriptional regulator
VAFVSDGRLTERTLQTARRDYTAREISRAAMQLFAERGFDAVTVEQIATQAGISARTFFRYFPTKEDVVFRYQNHLQDRLVIAFDARPAEEGPVTALRNAYVATSRVMPEDRDDVVLLGRFLEGSRGLKARSHGQHAVDREALIAALSARLGRHPRKREIAETIASAMGAAASTAFHRWVASGGRGDPSETVATALDILIHGLSEYDRRGTGSQ